MCIVRTEANYYAFACFNNNDCIPQFVRKMAKNKMSRIQISEYIHLNEKQYHCCNNFSGQPNNFTKIPLHKILEWQLSFGPRSLAYRMPLFTIWSRFLFAISKNEPRCNCNLCCKSPLQYLNR